MTVLQLNPALPLETPKGKAIAHFLIDYGQESDLVWVCFQQDGGEIWCWNNRDVRADKNITLGRGGATVTAGPGINLRVIDNG